MSYTSCSLNVSPSDKRSTFKEISSYIDLLFLILFFTMCFPMRTCEVTFRLKMAKFVQNYSKKKRAMKGKEERRKDRSETGGRKIVCLSVTCRCSVQL